MRSNFRRSASFSVFIPHSAFGNPVFHNLVFVSIRKTDPMQAYKIMRGLWGMGRMMFSKYLAVVDDDVDMRNTSEFAIGNILGLVATKKLSVEGFKRPWPPLIKQAATGFCVVASLKKLVCDDVEPLHHRTDYRSKEILVVLKYRGVSAGFCSGFDSSHSPQNRHLIAVARICSLQDGHVLNSLPSIGQSFYQDWLTPAKHRVHSSCAPSASKNFADWSDQIHVAYAT